MVKDKQNKSVLLDKLAGVGFLVAAAVMAYLFVYVPVSIRVKCTEPAEAVVISTDEHHQYADDDSTREKMENSGGTTYTTEYAYTVDGKKYAGPDARYEKRGFSTAEKHYEDDKVKIRYNPKKPSEFVTAGITGTDIFVCVITVMFAIFGYMLLTCNMQDMPDQEKN